MITVRANLTGVMVVITVHTNYDHLVRSNVYYRFYGDVAHDFRSSFI